MLSKKPGVQNLSVHILRAGSREKVMQREDQSHMSPLRVAFCLGPVTVKHFIGGFVAVLGLVTALASLTIPQYISVLLRQTPPDHICIPFSTAKNKINL